MSARLAIVHPPSVLAPADRDSYVQPSAAGKQARFRALYDAEIAFVWRNLRRLGVERDLEDRAQEVFVVAHRKFDDFEDRGFGARAWLFQIVLRVAADARRHRRRHPEDAAGEALERVSIEPDQVASLSRGERLVLLDAALARIPIERRAVLVLHEIEEVAAPAIAEILAVPVNTVYSRLRVGRTELEAAVAAIVRERGGER